MTVEISGVTTPARFARLADALAASWQSIRCLPLSRFQRDYCRYVLTRPDAEQSAAEILAHDGELALAFTLPDGVHVLYVRLAGLPRIASADCGRTP